MKVLFLSQRVPHPPDRGDRITTYHFLRHLRASGHDIKVGCLCEDDRDQAAAKELAGMVTEVCAPRIDRRWRKVRSLTGLCTGEALTLPFFRVAALQRAVDRWLAAGIDLVYVYSSSMALYVLGRRGPVKLMQFAELDSDKWRQYAQTRSGITKWIYEREARTLLAFETAVARDFEISCVVSEVEKELFSQRIPGVEPIVLRNGVDVELFESRGDAAREPHALVFTGVMDYEPNVDAVTWFVAASWPKVRTRFPDAKLWVVGSKPNTAITALDGRDGITVTGRVPETAPWFDRARVAIAPLRLARGVQNKVLEAMSMGLPVVCTPAAAQGLGQVDDSILRVAGDAESFADAVIELLADPERSAHIGRNAARFVREQFRWEAQFAVLDAVLAAVRAKVLAKR